MNALWGGSGPGFRAGAVAVLLAVLALVIGACGSDGDSTTTTVSNGTTTESSASDDEHRAAAIRAADPRGIYAESAPAVVTILSVFGDSTDPASQAQAGQGSGFVISDDGEIITNAHVVTNVTQVGGQAAPAKEADELYVEFGDRNQVAAEILGVDLNSDIAVIKVDPEGLDIQPVPLGNSDDVEVGEPVFAIGSPFGQEQSLSAGIVSATDRSIQSLTEFRIDGAIQTDTSINPGNSGGPLIDSTGRVVGVGQQINTTSGTNQGVGFAIPINLAKRAVSEIRESGEVRYAYIGVRSQALYPQLAEELGVDAPTGTLISSVVPGGPADEAGLRGREDGSSLQFQGRRVALGGDVVVAVDGQELVGESDLARFIAFKNPGDEVKLTIIRDGEEEEVDVTLGERPDS